MRAYVSKGLNVSVFESVLAMGDENTRAALARQLTILVLDRGTPEIEIQQIQPILIKLTLDPSLHIRRFVAEQLATATRIDVDVAFSIMADNDAIALPFLANNQALLASHYIAILKVGDEARSRVIGGRPDIMSDVADFIIRAGNASAALALCQNKYFTMGPKEYRLLSHRLGDSAELMEHLLALPELPLEIRILHAKRAANRMRLMIAEKGWVGGGDVSELCAEAEDNALMQVLLAANPEERRMATAYMSAKNMLTPAFIVRAAATGQLSVVEIVLAHLTGTSPQRITAQLYDASPAQQTSLFRRSGLPQSCFGILRAACDVMLEMRSEGVDLNAVEFGGRILEALMTRYDALIPAERSRQIEYLGRYGEIKIRRVARQVKADLSRAA